MNRKQRKARQMDLRRCYRLIGEDWRKPMLRGMVERSRVFYLAHTADIGKPSRLSSRRAEGSGTGFTTRR